MNIVKITGAAGHGKTNALQILADAMGGKVLGMSTVRASLPLLQAELAALGTHTFIDDVRPEDMVKLTKLGKLYPNTYYLYVAGEVL